MPYGRQWIDDDDVAAVVATLKSDYLTQGPMVPRFEEALCAATGARYAVAVSNGTAALHIASLAAGVRAGDVGITSSVTFVASANGIRYAGGRPMLADVDPETGLIDIADLSRRADTAAAAGTKPKVIVPVDLTGAVADLAGVRRIADKHGALVIEDAAHSLGASRDGERAGGSKHAHMAILSFHPVKHVTTAEGGAVTTDDEALYRELSDLRTHGITKAADRLEKNEGPWWYEQQTLGFNYRLTDLQCALGVSQMQKLPRFVARRREIAARYDRLLAPLSVHVRPLSVPSGVSSSYHLYVVQLVRRPGENEASVKARRKAAFLGLREQNIGPQVHYIPVFLQPDYIRHGLVPAGDDWPGARAYYAGCISLPMFPAMKDDDVDYVVDALRSLTQ